MLPAAEGGASGGGGDSLVGPVRIVLMGHPMNYGSEPPLVFFLSSLC